MPAIPYPVGKARLATKIVPLLPKRGHSYVEPFAGRGTTSSQIERKFIASMPFADLDATISDGLSLIHQNQTELVPFLLEMRERLHAQGKRTDLPDTPKGLTWEKWVESKKNQLGSLSTVRRLLTAPKEKTPTPPPRPKAKPFPKQGDVFEVSGRFFELVQDVVNGESDLSPRHNKAGFISLGFAVKEIAPPVVEEDEAHVFSVQPFDVVPWQFLDRMIGFYCDKTEPRILDSTVNTGRIWGQSSRPRIGIDNDPSVNPDVVGDNTAMPFEDQSFDVIVYDPPHTGDQGQSKTEFAAKYGIGVKSKNPETGKWGNLFHTYPPFLAEAKRVLRPGGILLAKLADVTHAAKFQFATAEFYNAAKGFGFELLGNHILPRKGVITDSKWKKASHGRQNHATWMIFANERIGAARGQPFSVASQNVDEPLAIV